MNTIITSATALVTTLLIGCSSDRTSTSAPTDQYFTGSVSCSEFSDTNATQPIDTTAGDTDSNTPSDTLSSDTSNNEQTNGQVGTTPGAELDCESEIQKNLPGPGVGQTGSGSLTINNKQTTLSAAYITIDQLGNDTNVIESVLVLHNGELRSSQTSSTNETATSTTTTVRVAVGIYNASIALPMHLSESNADMFAGGSYEILPPNDATGPTGAKVVELAVLAQDINGNATIDTDSETIRAISGNVNVSGTSPDWTITIDATLGDGSSLTGVYNGAIHTLPKEDH